MTFIHAHTQKLLKLVHKTNTYSVYDCAWDIFNHFLLYDKNLNSLTENDMVEFIAFLSLIPMVRLMIRIYVSGIYHHLRIHLLNDFQSSFLIALVLLGVTSPK